MSGTDVYEFLGRLADTDHRAEPVDTGFYQFPDPVASAFEHAQHVVEFLRWRDAREEWPAKGCRCQLLVDCMPEYHDGKIVMEPAWFAIRVYVTRWRYALGPCECKSTPIGAVPIHRTLTKTNIYTKIPFEGHRNTDSGQ